MKSDSTSTSQDGELLMISSDLGKETIGRAILKASNLFRVAALFVIIGPGKTLDEVTFSLSIVATILVVNSVIELRGAKAMLHRSRPLNRIATRRLAIFTLTLTTALVAFSYWLAIGVFILDITTATLAIVMGLNGLLISFAHVALRTQGNFGNIGWGFTASGLASIAIFSVAVLLDAEPTAVQIVLLFFVADLLTTAIGFIGLRRAKIRVPIKKLYTFHKLSLKSIIKCNIDGTKSSLPILIISASVALIDVIDRAFASRVGVGAASILTYGALAPLALRQVLDVKGYFSTKAAASATRDLIPLMTATTRHIMLLYALGSATIVFLLNWLAPRILVLPFFDGTITISEFDQIRAVAYIYLASGVTLVGLDIVVRALWSREKIWLVASIYAIALIIKPTLNAVFSIINSDTITSIALSTLVTYTMVLASMIYALYLDFRS